MMRWRGKEDIQRAGQAECISIWGAWRGLHVTFQEPGLCGLYFQVTAIQEAGNGLQTNQGGVLSLCRIRACVSLLKWLPSYERVWREDCDVLPASLSCVKHPQSISKPGVPYPWQCVGLVWNHPQLLLTRSLEIILRSKQSPVYIS